MDPNEQTGLLAAPDLTRNYTGDARAESEDGAAGTARRSRKPLIIIASVVTSLAVLAAALFFLLQTFTYPSPRKPHPGTDGPIRILITGNSISHGREGDYTWRYRIWQWLRDNHVDVEFVGPFRGTMVADAQVAPLLTLPLTPADAASRPSVQVGTNGGYALDVAPEFLHNGSAHFSAWGKQAAQDVDQIEEQVRAYRPDFLLVELGFNDLGWFVSGPEGTLATMKRIVDNARAANPELKVVIANAPQRTHMDFRDDLPVITAQYNELLKNAIPLWSYPNSPIELAKFREAYSCEPARCAAAYDGLHPNALGEYEIAYAFSEALYEKFAMGRGPLAVPRDIPARPCGVPRRARSQAGPGLDGIRFSWDAVYGAYWYEAQVRLQGTAWPADRDVFSPQEAHMDAGWTADGRVWDFRVRSYCGVSTKSGWSDEVSGVVPGEGGAA